MKEPKAATRGRTSLPPARFAGSPQSAANQTRIEQRFLRRWIEGADNPLFARARPDRCRKACAGQLREPLLGLCDLRTILVVERVAGVTRTIHHDLSCHLAHSDWLPEAGWQTRELTLAGRIQVHDTPKTEWLKLVPSLAIDYVYGGRTLASASTKPAFGALFGKAPLQSAIS